MYTGISFFFCMGGGGGGGWAEGTRRLVPTFPSSSRTLSLQNFWALKAVALAKHPKTPKTPEALNNEAESPKHPKPLNRETLKP